MVDDYITISISEYNFLVQQSKWLGYLEAAGVEDWDGYEVAMELKDLYDN